MKALDFEPEMVGREKELNELQQYLDRAKEGKGSTLFISGEAGIGKTRLVDELKSVAKSKGFHVLTGNSMYESLTPYMPFLDALRSGNLDHLFAEEVPKVECVYLVTETGLLVKEILREETELDSDLFSSMLTIVADFVKDSLAMLKGKEKSDTLNRLGYGDYTILIESRMGMNLVVILSGRENEFLVNDMREILENVNTHYGHVLKAWDGNKKGIEGIELMIRPLITSGKYDGIHYGRDNPKAKRNLLFENVSMGIMRHAQKTPTLLCIEDLQWADPSSLALMHYVARNAKKCGILILGTYRPEDVSVGNGKVHPFMDMIRLMSREELYESIELHRLTKEDQINMLKMLFEEIDISDEFRDKLFEETEGNPLFIIELVKLMVEEEVIKAFNETWRLTKPIEEINVPSKIFDVISRRLNRIPLEDRKVLDYASVIGEEFASQVLVTALDMNRLELLEQLRVLEQTHRLVHAHNGSYKFDHAKIKEVLYGGIPTELRMEYHAIVAGSIEKLNTDNLEEVTEDLAYHYFRCRNRQKAPHYLIKAAENAKMDFSNTEAIRFYSEALEMENETDRRREILEALGDIYDLVGDYDKSMESFRNALELTDQKKKEGEIKTKIGGAHFNKGEYDKSFEIYREALDLVKDEDCKEKAFALSNIGIIHDMRGESEKALEHYEKSLDICKKIGDAQAIAKRLNNIGIVRFRSGEPKKALEKWEESLKLFQQLDDQMGITGSLNNIANVYVLKNDYDKALELWEESLEICKRIGDLRGIALAHFNIGGVYGGKGDYDRSLENLEKSYEISMRTGDQRGIALSTLDIGVIHLRKDNYTEAIENIKKSLQILEGIGDPVALAYTLRHLGRTLTQMGEYDKAIEYCEKGMKMGEITGNPEETAFCYCDIAEAHLKNKNLNEALKYCNDALALSKQIGSKETYALSRKVLGMIYCEQKKWNEAIENFEDSIEIYKEIGLKYELANSNFEFGLMWKAKGDAEKAKVQLNKAVEIFQKLKLEKKALKASEALR